MLELIREKMQGTFATVIVGFFCAAFALWGVERVFDGRSNSNVVAKVNGEEITAPELSNAIENMRRRYIQMLGGKVDPSFLNDKMLREPALDSLISRKLLEEQAAAMKMAVGQATIDKAIVSDPMFSKDGKTFDVDYYKEKLRAAGISAESYRRQMNDQLVMQHLRDGVVETAFVTGKQVQDIARLESQVRSFEFLRFSLQDAMQQTNPDEESIAKYYNDHKADFLTEEKVTIEYLELNRNGLAKDIAIDEADIRSAYDKEAANFKASTERHAAHILIEALPDGSEQGTLQEIQKRLAAGESFAALAKEFSKDEGSAGQGGDVGFTTGETFVPEFESALAALKNPGDVSAPVKTEFGYHIIKLLEQRQSAVPTYEERKEAIAKELRSVKAAALFSEKLDQLSESTYSAGDLSGPAAELGMTVQKTAPFGRQGGLAIASQKKIIDAAFSSELVDSGKNSQAIELDDDKAVVLRVVNHDLPKTQELAAVKEQIVESLRREQAAAALKTRVEALKVKLLAGQDLVSLASGAGVPVVSSASRTRTAGGDDAELVEAAFRLPKAAAGTVIAETMQSRAGDWILLHLLDVQEQDPSSNSELLQSVRGRLDGASSSGDFAAYEQGLRDKAEITRKESAPVENDSNENSDKQ